jgi:hypothetical protein
LVSVIHDKSLPLPHHPQEAIATAAIAGEQLDLIAVWSSVAQSRV